MHASRLYLPTVARSREQMFVLGSERVLKDFLARQRGRAQMLVAYAEPFLSLLSASSGEVMDVSVQVLADFWQNSILELQRDLQSREPEGQVAALEAYFIHVLDKLDYRQCARQFAAYASPEPGNDLFSQYRYQLASMAELRCKDYRQSVVRGMYAALAGRFNRELAGRYPFAGADALDASPATVRAFLLDYAAQRRSLEEYLDALPEPRHKLTDFVRELDAVAAFFRSNLSAGEVAQPFRLQLAFNLQRRDSSGADQVLAWGLRNDSLMAGWPNRATTLDWHVGEHLTLDLGWAPQSRWAPMADPQQVDMQVEGRRASFALQSPWALLRMIERHAMSDPRSAASEELLLGFSVPLQGAAEAAQPARSQARLYLGVTLLETSPKTRAEVPLRLPERFPWSAPVL
jgi:type VI secretion system protein ImpL